MKAIREAEWYGPATPRPVKVSPHGLRAVCSADDAARLRRHARRSRCPSLRRPRRVAATSCVAVVTRPDAPGRPGPPPGALAGRARGPTRTASRCSPRRSPATPEFLDRAARRSPRTAARSSRTARWCRRAALDIPRHGWVNLHFSLLPAWRGAAPVQHAVLARRRGHRRQHLPARAGPRHRPGVRRRSPSRSGPATPPATCSAGSPCPAPALLVATLDGIEAGHAHARAAAGTRASPSRPRSPSRTRGSTGPSRPYAVDRRIRACTPAPGAWTTFRGERLKLGPVRASRRRPRCRPASCWCERRPGPASARPRRRSRSATSSPPASG